MRRDEEWLAEYRARQGGRTPDTTGHVEDVHPAAAEPLQPAQQALDIGEDVARERVRQRATKALERPILYAVLRAVRAHPGVAWAVRMNTGMATFGATSDGGDGGRTVRFAYQGCADILGQMKDGRLLAIEVKRPGEHPTPAQAANLHTVRQNNGVALCARSSGEAIDGINAQLAVATRG